MSVDPTVLSIIVGTVLPIVTGAVSKLSASSAVKASVLALLSGAAGVLNAGINSGGYISQDAVVQAAITWVVAVATYFGFLKPTTISNAVNETVFPDKGVG